MTAMLDYARKVLEQGGHRVIETRELPTGYGWKLLCVGGGAMCVYRTGKFVAEGRNAAVVKALFAAAPPPPPKPPTVAKPGVTGSAADEGPFVPRYPSGWSWEPWDGVTAPF